MSRSALLPCAGFWASLLMVALPQVEAHHPGDAFPVTLTSLGGVSSRPALVHPSGDGGLALGFSSTYLRVSGHPQWGPVVGGNGSVLISGVQVRVRAGEHLQVAALVPWISGFPDDWSAQGGAGDPLLAAQVEGPMGDLRLGTSLMSTFPLGDAARGHGAGMLQTRVGAIVGGDLAGRFFEPSGKSNARARVLVDAGLSWGWLSNGATAVDYALTLQLPALGLPGWMGFSVEARAQTALTSSPPNPLAFAVKARRSGDTVLVVGPMMTAVLVERWELALGPRIPMGSRLFDWGWVLLGGFRFGG